MRFQEMLEILLGNTSDHCGALRKIAAPTVGKCRFGNFAQ